MTPSGEMTLPPQSSTPSPSGDGSHALATIGPPPGTRRTVAGFVLVLVVVVLAGLWGRSDGPAPVAPSIPAVRSAAPSATPRAFALTIVNESSSPYAEIIVNLHRVAVASCGRDPVILRAGTDGLPPLPWTVYAASIRAYDKFEYAVPSGDRTILVSDSGIDDLPSTPSALPGTTPPPCLGSVSPPPTPGISRERAAAQAIACAPSSATPPVLESIDVMPPADVKTPMPVARDGVDWVWAVRLRVALTSVPGTWTEALVAVDFTNGTCLSTTEPAPPDTAEALPGLPTAPWGDVRTLPLPEAEVRRVPEGLPAAAHPRTGSWSATSYEPRVYVVDPDTVWVGGLGADTWSHGRLPLAAGERVHRVTVDGPWVVAVASRALGTAPADGSCPRPGEVAIAWRVFAARIGGATMTFRVVDRGRNERPFRLPDEPNTPCSPPDAIVAVSAGRVADVHEATDGGATTRATIEVRSLADASLVEGIGLDGNVGSLALSATTLAWSQTGNALVDGEQPDWRVRAADLHGGGLHDVDLGVAATEVYRIPPTLVLDGDAVVASIMRVTDGATTIVRVQGRAIAGVAPLFPGQTCGPMGADRGVIVISCSGPNGTWIGAWSATSGLRAVPTPAPQVGEIGVVDGWVGWTVLDGTSALTELVPIASLR